MCMLPKHLPQRFVIHLKATAPLPLTYREGLQAALYRLLPSKLARWIHDEGVSVDGRPFKPLVFSRILGLELKEDRRFYPRNGSVRFAWSSFSPTVADAISRSLHRQGGLLLYGHLFPLVFIEELPLPEPQGILEVFTLSPITVRQTKEGRIIYPSPHESEFSDLIQRNLNRKAAAAGLPPGEVRIRSVQGVEQKVERYKGEFFRGWMGRFVLEGDEHLLRLALTAGLGGKNAQGFGYVLEATKRI